MMVRMSKQRVVGTDGNDKLYGDTSGTLSGPGTKGTNTIIFGLDGNDEIYGDSFWISSGAMGGNDLILGGPGRDSVYGDAWSIDGSSRGGNDTIWASGVIYGDAYMMSGIGGRDRIFGSTGDDTISGDGGSVNTGGNDRIIGNGGKDTIYGDGTYAYGRGSNDFIRRSGALFGDALAFSTTSAIGGNDTIHGSEGADYIVGDANEMKGQGGNDKLHGAGGDDVIYGDGREPWKDTCGNDRLFGGEGNDTLYGDTGNDGNWVSVYHGIVGGDDILTGGRGDDAFVFFNGSGVDKVTDFSQRAGNRDKIVLSGFNLSGTDIHNFEDLRPLMQDTAAGVVIRLNAGSEITLAGIRVAQLSGADFEFRPLPDLSVIG